MAQFMKLLKLGEKLAQDEGNNFYKIAGWFGWSLFTLKKPFMALFSLFLFNVNHEIHQPFRLMF